MINVYQPQLGAEELEAIGKVFESNWLGKGRLTSEFEQGFANHLGVAKNNVVSTNCCSEGLFLSMDLFDIHAGDEVILPTCSFVGAANSIKHCGAEIAFCDSDPHTLNTTAEYIEKAITPKTKAILLIHYGGVACEMDDICDLARRKGLKIIEDAACGVSSTYKGKALGTIGDMGMWSFDAMKILVCGDGAMLYLKDEEIRERAEKLMYFGLESKSGYSNSVDKKWWEFDISSYGHRAIMNDITAAMALEQLKKLPAFIERRHQIHDMYMEGLADVDWLRLPDALPEYMTSSYYFYHVQVMDDSRDDFAKFLRDRDIYTTFRYYPLHWVDFYGHSGEHYEGSEWAANHTLCLPIHHSLKDEEVHYIIETIKAYKL